MGLFTYPGLVWPGLLLQLLPPFCSTGSKLFEPPFSLLEYPLTRTDSGGV